MAYVIQQADAGYTPIANLDAGITPPNSATIIPTPPNQLGMIVKAVDPTLGGGEFIMLGGVASTVVGSVVVYDLATFLTALAPVGTNKPQPIAFAMAANVSATSFAWYQISGTAVAAKTSGVALASNAAVGVLTIGLIAATASGKEVQGALTIAKASTPKTVKLVINRPHMQGRVT